MNDVAAGRIGHPFAERPGPGEAVEVAPGVLWMRITLPMVLNHVNVFALDDGDGWTIVDTGMMTDQGRAEWQALLGGPLAGRPVRRVVVTHHHPDHVGLAGGFVERGAELCIPRTAWLLTRMLTFDVQPVHRPESLAFYRRCGLPPDRMARLMAERPYNFADKVEFLPLGYTRLRDGGTIRMGGRTWDIRMGDGHAPEQATFWSRDDALVIGGDQILPGISPNLGVYPTEPEADPVAEWIASCERLMAFARDDQLVLPGHKLPFTGLPFRLGQMIQNHHAALERLEAALARPLTVPESFAPLYQREIRDGEWMLALAEAVAHLNHLHQTGRARRWTGKDGALRWQRRVADFA
jgi:glyoxylase-like metal-dependent hydrolase (beta-lactamase superfamily II)